MAIEVIHIKIITAVHISKTESDKIFTWENIESTQKYIRFQVLEILRMDVITRQNHLGRRLLLHLLNFTCECDLNVETWTKSSAGRLAKNYASDGKEKLW